MVDIYDIRWFVLCLCCGKVFSVLKLKMRWKNTGQRFLLSFFVFDVSPFCATNDLVNSNLTVNRTIIIVHFDEVED